MMSEMNQTLGRVEAGNGVPPQQTNPCVLTSSGRDVTIIGIPPQVVCENELASSGRDATHSSVPPQAKLQGNKQGRVEASNGVPPQQDVVEAASSGRDVTSNGVPPQVCLDVTLNSTGWVEARNGVPPQNQAVEVTSSGRDVTNNGVPPQVYLDKTPSSMGRVEASNGVPPQTLGLDARGRVEASNSVPPSNSISHRQLFDSMHRVILRNRFKRQLRKQRPCKITKVGFFLLMRAIAAFVRPPPLMTRKTNRKVVDYILNKKTALQGATRQNDDTPDVEQIFTNTLNGFNVSGPLATSISATMAAIIFSIIAIVKNRKNGKIAWIVTSLVTTVVALIFQIIEISGIKPQAGFREFVSETTRNLVQPTMTPQSAKGFVDWVRTSAKTFDEVNEMRKQVESAHPGMLLNVPHLPQFQFDGRKTLNEMRANIIRDYKAYQYWTFDVVKRICNFDKASADFCHVYLIEERDRRANDNDDQGIPDYVYQHESPSTDSDDETTELIETTADVHVDPNDYLEGATPQMAFDTVVKLLKQLIGLFAGIGVCIAFFLTGKTVDFSTLSRNWDGVDVITGKFSTVLETIASASGKPTEQETLQQTIQKYVDDLNNLICISASTYASHAGMRQTLKEKLQEVENFLKIPMDPKKADKTILTQIYGACNKFKADIEQAAKEQTVRQEPRLFLFYGKPSSGKTKTCEYLSTDVGVELWPELDPGRRQITITPAGKYFPRLGGEPQWIVDEVAGRVDFHEDLIFNNLRGLCSSARFGADTAEIGGKDQGAECKVIYGATNTHPDVIMGRIAENEGMESCEPCASRMIVYETLRSEEYGELDPSRRDSQSYDTTGQMRHVRYREYRLNTTTMRYEQHGPLLTYQQVKQNVVNKIRQMESAHIRTLNRIMAAQGATQQLQSKQHFVINLHGPPLAGKGRAIDEILPQLVKYTRFPVRTYTKEHLVSPPVNENRRVIAVVDDLLPVDLQSRKEAELWYMQLYNNALKTGSIIILVTNILPQERIPKFSFIPDATEVAGQQVSIPKIHISPRYEIPVSEPGILRRMGWMGNIAGTTTHSTGVCFKVSNDRYYPQAHQSIHISSLWLACLPPLLFLTQGLAFAIPPLVFFTYVAYVFLFRNRPSMDKSRIFDYIITKYQEALRTWKDLTVEYCSIPVNDAAIKVECNSLSDLRSSSLITLTKHIFSNSIRYQASTLPWKIFVRSEIAPTLSANAERFLTFAPTDDVDSIVTFFKLCNEMFAVCAMPVDVLLQCNTGTFYMAGGKLMIDRRTSVDADGYQIICLPEHLAITPNNADDDLHNIYVKWDSVVAFMNYGENIPQFETFSPRALHHLFTALYSREVLTSEQYIAARSAMLDSRAFNYGKAKIIEIKDMVRQFLESNTGKIIAGIVAAIVLLITSYGLYKLCTSDDDDVPRRRRPRKFHSLDVTDSSDDEALVEQRKKSKRPNEERTAPLNSDRDTRRRLVQERKPKKKTNDRLEPYHSDRERRRTHQIQRAIPQSVKELPEMNGYSEFHSVVGEMHDKVSKNECWVSVVDDNRDVIEFKTPEDRDSTILTSARCYALFIRKYDFVTVGHVCEFLNGKNLYVACDQYKNNIYKAKLIKTLRSCNRDLSFWTMAENPHHNKLMQFRDISNCFVDKLSSIPSNMDTVIKRYGKENHEEYLYGNMWYEADRCDSVDADGNPYALEHYGFLLFSFSTLALTTYGDCGLPYYSIIKGLNKNPQVKLTGLHCMGNQRGSYAVGIAAMLTQHDFKHFNKETKQITPQVTPTCEWCTESFLVTDPLPNKKQSEYHKVLWNSDHLANQKSFIAELRYWFDKNPTWSGYIRKAVGPLARGSVEHSHTHFEQGVLDQVQEIKAWEKIDDPQFGKVIETVFKVQTIRSLDKWLVDHDFIEQFWVSATYFQSKPTRRGKTLPGFFVVDMVCLQHSLTQAQLDDLLKPPARKEIMLIDEEEELYYIGDEKVYMPRELANILKENSIYNDHDIPFTYNEATSLISALPHSVSRDPTPAYERVPGSELISLPMTKIPMSTDVESAPEDQYVQLALDHDGVRSQRATQTVQWQGKHYRLPMTLMLDVLSEYSSGLQIYENCRELTDREVFYGTQGELTGGLSSLELNRSIGYTLSALFNVTLKEHVIELTEEGKYSWRDNDAAKYSQQWYRKSKKMVRNGICPRTTYLEMIKMEKLKKSKNFIARLICASDLNGILVARKFLGSFIAISTLKDKTVGVGFNPWADFNKMAIELRKKNHYFTGDYKRWDKTLPRVLFEMMGRMLDDLNPEAPYYSLLFKEIYASMHVSGRTVFIKSKGMPSGSLLTANLNCKLNDLACYTCFYKLAQRNGFDPSYASYEEHIFRKFYGDDVIFGVSDEAIKWFNMETLRTELSETFGFVLDSSEKDGMIYKEMSWGEISWCSRYFRDLMHYNYTIGALKKDTIYSMLHWKRKTSDDAILAAQLNVAMIESAAWEKSFYREICEAVKILRSSSRYLEKYVTILPYEVIQEDIYDEGMRANLIRHVWNIIEEMEEDDGGWYEDPAENSIKFEFEREQDLKSSPHSHQNISKAYSASERIIDFARRANTVIYEMGNAPSTQTPHFTEQELVESQVNNSDYVSRLNVMAQSGLIAMPFYVYAQDSAMQWHCQAETKKLNNMCAKTLYGCAQGRSKAIAKEGAAYQLYIQIESGAIRESLRKELMKGMKQQMNVSAPDSVPVVQSTGRDLSLTAGSMVFSNTNFAQGITNLNPVSFAVNNIAQTGAPFDIKDSCYAIMQLEKSTTVSGVQAVGSEIFRFSLNPTERPELHQQYILSHEDHIPSVDFGIYIGGTAGAIGTLKIGFVKDASKPSYTLSELQAIASQDVALSQSSTVAFRINDIRRNGLYRKVIDDDEPYPGVVCLVSNAVTNVQRNDSVLYPIQIYSRLAPDYMLASPIARISNTDYDTINLNTYFTLPSFDIAINGNTIVSEPTDTVTFNDCGYTSGTFNPVINSDNFYAFTTNHYSNTATNWYSSTPETDPGTLQTTNNPVFIDAWFFAFGEVPRLNSPYLGNNTTSLGSGTLWQLQQFSVRLGNLGFVCSTAFCFEKGCVLQLVPQRPPTWSDGNDTYNYSDSNLKNSAGQVILPEYDAQYAVCGYRLENNTMGYIRQISFNVLGTANYTGRLMVATPDTADVPLSLNPWTNSAVVSLPTLYTWTWLATGNTSETYAAPSGFTRMMFVRTGTSLKTSIPVSAPYTPGYTRLSLALDTYRERKQADWVTGYFAQDNLDNDFQFAYKNGIFLVKTSTNQAIRVSLDTSRCMIRGLDVAPSPNSITSFTGSGSYTNWVVSGLRFRAQLYLEGARKQMMAAGMAIGGLGGLFQGMQTSLMNEANMRNYNMNQSLNRALQEQLQKMKGDQQLALSKQNYEQQLSALGFSSPSAQAGNLEHPSGKEVDVPFVSVKGVTTDSVHDYASVNSLMNATNDDDPTPSIQRNMIDVHDPETYSLGNMTLDGVRARYVRTPTMDRQLLSRPSAIASTSTDSVQGLEDDSDSVNSIS